MKKEVLIQELQELENQIKMYKKSGENNYFGNAYAETAKMDLERVQYQYKVKTVDLSTDDRNELAQLAVENGIKLNYLFDLVFTEEEKEEYEEAQSFWGKPMSEDYAELNKQLDEAEEEKNKEKEAIKTKKQGFRLFGRTK